MEVVAFCYRRSLLLSVPIRCHFPQERTANPNCYLSVPLPTIQSETWLVRVKVCEPHLNPHVRVNFLPLVKQEKGT